MGKGTNKASKDKAMKKPAVKDLPAKAASKQEDAVKGGGGRYGRGMVHG